MTIGQIASSVTYGTQALQASRMRSESSVFENLISKIKEKDEGSSEKSGVASKAGAFDIAGKNVSSSQIAEIGRINGDWRSDFSGLYTSENDRNSPAQGAAANSSSFSADKKIDRTSKLYEKSLELESYFVKMMVSSMRKTISKAAGNTSYAQSMYEDMIYDEYTASLTKNARFGLADQIYLELSV